ncbi:histidine kinase [Paenibacillus athensensis]|uniref:HAMP domain-containing protein n=1 Tax=Paenibacillus athensensis TaxID=1967502 RepID=A0A4Y8QAA6_9BACL|nr:histidine kinase [Paenibacillus athensensis]MCD1260333.1 histidine kinase [Paenibacillus athensensis]
MRQATLRSRLIMGFGFVTVPLVVLLLCNNLYATKVVHTQVALTNQNLLTMYMNDMDKVLEELENYLYKTAEQDQSLISLSQYGQESWEYYLAKTQTVNALYLNTNYYSAADVLFAYSTKYDDLFLAQQQSVSYEDKQLIQDKLYQLVREQHAGSAFYSSWNIVKLNDRYALVMIVDTGYQSFIGAWVDLDRLMMPLHLLNNDQRGEALLFSDAGDIMAGVNSEFVDRLEATDFRNYVKQDSQSYHIVNLEKPYLLVVQRSKLAAMSLLMLLPESSLLEGLPVFRKLTYAVPLLAAGILVFYLIFVQKSLVKPIHSLIQGMRRIRAGDLSARLDENKLTEFIVINETFNGMAKQIEHLKIDIYEEQIRTQKAELKHLQAQIHPHFFMNSLNIVYHLAQIKEYDLIQNMSLHLVRYFRYSTRTQITTITIKDELEHVYNYLSIQKLRFPESLIFDIDVEPGLESVGVPPLIVQPLAENCVIHGFSVQSGEPFAIRIRVTRDPEAPDQYLLVEVADNGKGFTPDKLAELEARVYATEPGEGSIGLWNIVRRGRLYFKSEIQMTFANALPRGASVVLRLPQGAAEPEGGNADV